MSWLKVSDVAADHPLMLRVWELDWCDERLPNELFGWVAKCATRSAAFDKDYIIELGTAKTLAGLPRYQELLEAALYCGLMERKEFEDDKGMRRPGLKLVEEEDLFHMILKSEKERNKNREADNRKPERSGPVRKRDGDECRWCGVIVRFSNGAGGDQKSARVGTIDHLDPKDLDSSEPTPMERLVVACKTCNSSRKDGATWDRQLRPVPENPYYSKATAQWLLDKCGYRVKVSEKRTELFDPAPAPAFEGTTADMPDWARPASDDATDTTGASSIDSKATAVVAVERPRSHSDLLAFPAVPEDDETVETPIFGETPVATVKATDTTGLTAQHSSNQQQNQTPIKQKDRAVETPTRGETPVDTRQATDTTGRTEENQSTKTVHGSNTDQRTDQLKIKDRSTKTRVADLDLPGRVGKGWEGSGSSIPVPPDSSKPFSSPKSRSRRRRPRRRKN